MSTPKESKTNGMIFEIESKQTNYTQQNFKKINNNANTPITAKQQQSNNKNNKG